MSLKGIAMNANGSKHALRALAVAVTIATAASGMPATTAAAQGPSAAERGSWSEQERRAWGAHLWDERPTESAFPAVEVPASAVKDQAAVLGTTAWAEAHKAAQEEIEWPEVGSTHVPASVTAFDAVVGGLPMTVSSPTTGRPLGRGMQVRVVAAGPGVVGGADGVVLELTSDPTATDIEDPGQVELEIDLAGFGPGVSQDWLSRLRLVQLPACAATTPDEVKCAPGPALSNQVLNVAAATVSAPVTLEAPTTAKLPSTGGRAAPLEVALPAPATIVALAAGASGSTGNWSATPLSPSASWQVTAGTGGFAWSYPMRVPPVPGGLTPVVDLGYNSGSLDGRTASTNNQSTLVGDGWDLAGGGFVERKYASCADDTAATAAGAANNASHPTGDLCWGTDNATLVLGGRSMELVRDGASNVWRTRSDDNTVVEHLTGAWNGDNDTEFWKVTTSDGTQYWFGRDKRSATDTAALNSSWVVPVYGNHPGEPCYQATFAASRCQQTWRWNLDYVVDPSGNSMTYFYSRETNYYSYDLGAGVAAYQRGGFLARVEYGTRSDSLTAAAPARVVYSTAERCVAAAADCEPADLTAATAARFPDVPFDLICTSSTSCPGNYSPTFFTRSRLTAVTTSIRKADGTYRNVDQWTLTHSFPDPGDGDLSDAVLWLKSVQHTGLGATTGVTLPATTFVGTQYVNRVDTNTDGRSPMRRFRLSSITTEAGGTTSITYSPPDCTAGSLPAAPESNTRRCFPVFWTPAGSSAQVMEYFHKYVATQVVDSAEDGTSSSIVTNYSYPAGGAAWRYDDDELTPAKYRTWSDWRGFDAVDVFVGEPGDAASPQRHTRYRYFRGMNADRAGPDGGTRSATVDGITDHDDFAGMVREEIVYDRDVIATDTFSTPWRSAPTATSGARSAFHIGVSNTETRTTASAVSGGVRVTRTSTTFDAYGMPVTVDDQGDVATTTDDQCARTTYVRNTAANILETVQRVEVVGKACAAETARPGDLISDQRYAYDGLGVGTVPTKGLVTVTQEINTYSGTSPGYVTTATTTYDAYGRKQTSKDALGRTTTTAYTDTAGLNTATATTSPDPDGTGALTAHVTRTTVDPAWGATLSATDAAGNVTSGAYDALGRLTGVWEPGRVQSASVGANTTFAYEVGKSARSSVTTKTLNWDGTAYLTSSVIYDGLLRQRQTQTPSADRAAVGRLVTDTLYDSRGLATLVTRPWYTSGAPAPALVTMPATVPGRTLTKYDGAGREIESLFQINNGDRWRTTTSYGGDRVTVDPPDGATPTTTVSDARGHTTSLLQYTATTPTGTPKVTTYVYDVAGRMTGMTDPAGTTWGYGYDLRGRRTSATDPDSGATATTYDVAGQVLTTTDARGKVLGFTYDALGRKTSVREGGTAGTVRASWSFDTLVKGQVTSSTRVDTTGSYVTAAVGYDDHGRPTGTKVTVPSGAGALAGTYQTDYTYTLDGRIRTVKLPKAGNLNAETVTTYYDAANQPEWMGGGFGFGTYVSGTTRSPYGELLMADMGGSWAVQENWAYEQGSRRLTQQWVVREGATGHDLDLSFVYDQAGNPTRVTDAPTQPGRAGETQCFTYDGLRHLTAAWTPSTAACGTPASGSLGGPAPYWQSWTFDTAGNRATQVVHATTAGGTNTTSTYAHPAATGAHPHAVTSVTRSGGATGTSTFTYDAAGNTVGRSVAGQPAQTLAWDTEGKPSSVTEAGVVTDAYVYSADGDRLLRKQDGNTTVYLPGGQELTATGTTVTSTRYYTFDGRTVAARAATGTAGTSTIVADAHDTALLQVIQATNTVQRSYTDPYGNTRGTSPALTGDHGFLDKPTDTTGLTAVGARYYDPVTGRFITVDPLLDLNHPQQWNPYAYSNNNPLTWSDPTGLRVTETDNGDRYLDPRTLEILDASSFNAVGLMSGWATMMTQRVAGGFSRTLGKSHTSEVKPPTTRTPARPSAPDRGEAPKARAAANTAAKACSFTGATLVLMGDGTKKPIDEVQVGDEVLASDPQTGEQEPRKVTHVFVHEDTVSDLGLEDGTVLGTTENHPFWSVTDERFERADELGTGEKVLTADGRVLMVDGLDDDTARTALAYNLAVDGIHTYHVGDDEVLVHNACLPALRNWTSERFQFGNSTFQIDKSGMTHILERHHPTYWDGSVKTSQSFFDESMSIDDVQAAIAGVARQNREQLSRIGAGSGQVQGNYGGVDYVLGVSRGRIGQFYPRTLP